MSLSYLIGQSTKFVWYSTHYLISFKYATPIKIDRQNPPPFFKKMPSGKKLFYEMLKLFNEERNYINQKKYKIPKTNVNDFANIVKGSFNFFMDLPKIDKRRTEKKFNDLNEKNEDLPKYFLRNFHYQTDGYLSENSANLYEFQVETLFSGSAATMRRFSLLPIIEYLKSKDEDLNFLDVGTGSGEFIKTIKYNFPKLKITCSDISKAYLEVAKKKLKKFTDINYKNCKGEDLPFKNESFDILNSVYLFHEVPSAIRSKIFSEISRVLKKDGVFILTDSLQLGDNYILDPLLEFFPYSTHEPYYSKYIREDLVSNAEKFGLKMYYSKNAYLSKTLAFKKI